MIGHTDLTDVYLINKKSEIDILDILNEFTTESSIHTMYENDTGKINSLANMLEKIYQAILNSIASVFDMLSDLFNKDGKISKEEYLKSRQGEMVFDYNIVKQQKYINSKAKEGNSLMKRLLRGESIHDKVVDFVNGVARTLESKDGRNKIYASAAPIVYASQVDLKDTLSEFKSLNKNVLYKIDNPNDLNVNDIKMIARTTQALSARANNLVAMYFKQYDKLDKTDMKKMKGMRVK